MRSYPISNSSYNYNPAHTEQLLHKNLQTLRMHLPISHFAFVKQSIEIEHIIYIDVYNVASSFHRKQYQKIIVIPPQLINIVIERTENNEKNNRNMPA